MAERSIFNNENLKRTMVNIPSPLSGPTNIQSSGYTMDDKIKPIIQDLLDGIHAQLDTITGIRHHLHDTVCRIHPIPNYPEPGECGPNNSPIVPSIVGTLKGIQEALKVEVSKLDEISNHLKTVV